MPNLIVQIYFAIGASVSIWLLAGFLFCVPHELKEHLGFGSPVKNFAACVVGSLLMGLFWPLWAAFELSQKD